MFPYEAAPWEVRAKVAEARLAEVEVDLAAMGAILTDCQNALAEVERERDKARARVAKAEREWAGWQNECARFAEERDEARARVAAAYKEATQIVEADLPGTIAELGEHSGEVRFIKDQAASILALARPEETDALNRIRAEAYREGWRFAYDQCERTGSVPDPDYVAIREDKT